MRTARERSLRGDLRLLLRTVRLFRPYRRTVLLVCAATIVSSGLGAAIPLIIRRIFDDALYCGSGCPKQGLLYRLVGAIAVIVLVTGQVGLAETRAAARVGQSVMRDLRQTLYERLQAMPVRFFTTTRTGEIQSRLTNDVGGVENVVGQLGPQVFSGVVFVVSSVAAMLLMSWELTLVSLLFVPPFAWLAFRAGRRGQDRWHSVGEARADLTALAEETLSVAGAIHMKVFGRQREAAERFKTLNQTLADREARAQLTGRTLWAIFGGFFALGPAVIFVIAATNPGGTAVSAGTVVAFTTLQARIVFPIGELFNAFVSVQGSFAFFERIFDYIDMRSELEDRPDAVRRRREEVRGRIEFEHVSFRYLDRAPYALRDVSLTVEPGQLAALVGPTGAGKTTLSYLVRRLYEPQHGVVRLDGIDVSALAADTLAEVVAMVTQETFLLHTSVRENLLYAKPDATEEELEAATRAAYIYDRIVDLPEGFDTLVGERGYRLSGGEKQRLAIARAILRNPRILVLDEATSALDTSSERIVQAALRPLMAERTTIAIAHRLSTILSADVIFVLDRGRIVERGRHDELVAANGLYATLYREQFSDGFVEALCEDGVVLSTGGILRASAAP